MNAKGKTKEEKFLVRLYQENSEGSDRYEIGTDLGFHPKTVDTICQVLHQANFIRKQGKIEITITDLGSNLAKQLLED